jgi:outer membrane lipoprotein carrier protein
MKTAAVVPVLALLVAAIAPLATPLDASAQTASATAQPGQPKKMPADETATYVTKVQTFYDQSKTFRSPFKQVFVSKLHGGFQKQSGGTVLFSKPGKMSWTYDNPAGNRVVSNGSLLRVYEKANTQMYEQAVDKSQYPAALSFLTGGGKLADTFNFDGFKGEEMSFKGGVVLMGNPKTPTAAYSKVVFYVDRDSSQVRRVMIIDAQGNRNTFEFTKPEINIDTKAGDFDFTPPAGTTIIRP